MSDGVAKSAVSLTLIFADHHCAETNWLVVETAATNETRDEGSTITDKGADNVTIGGDDVGGDVGN